MEEILLYISLSLLIRAFWQTGCVKLVVLCDVTLCELVDDRFLPSYPKKEGSSESMRPFTENLTYLLIIFC